MLGESGWIKNDEIIAVVVTVEIIESIVADGLMALITGEVHSHVELRELNSLCAAVYRMHNLGTASHGIDREASRIAEHVKHALALGIVLKQGAIFTLVNKESCLLAFEPVDMKLQSVLHGHIVIGVSIKEPVFLMEVFLHRQCRLTLVEHIFYSAFHHLEQRLADPVTAVVHAHAVRLNDSGLTVAIDDEPGEIVALSMNEPICIVVRIVSNPDANTHIERRANALLPKTGIDRLILKGEDTDRNGTFLIMPYRNEVAVGIHHPHDIAFLYAVIHVMDGTGEDPRMEALQRFVLTFLKIYVLVHLYSLFLEMFFLFSFFFPVFWRA